ncbi:hypothetical protein F2Q68_00035883 [Brassica cretica]|uniref:FCP1 homology domain-containing protein n=1 Tax=Brassica cretica TaxID=69181 RepID=A0A8S9H2T0_BRACR|nr:hypothetical protein F2Q68_00035883 [Brassica cretica]
MPYIDMKSKTSKPLGVVSKKPKPTIRNSSSLPKISGHLESITTTATLTCQDEAKQQLGSDTFARDVKTNEPAEMLVEDTSQSQAFASSVDAASESVAKMEMACNHMLNSDTIFSPVLNDELDGADRGNSVHWEIPRWGGDESSNKICFDNQTCNVSDFFISDVLIASLPFDESGNNDAFTEISPLPHFIFPEQYIYWPRDTLRKKDVTLVLDLDETLVHSTLESCSGADFSFRVFFNMQENTVYVKQRPHLYKFLERVVELFHVVIFTASHSIYASQLLDILDPDGKFISQRFYRDSCILSEGIYTKDLTVLGLDLAKVAIIDNCPQVYRLQINNGIPIKSWYDDPTDDGLITILPFLETLAVADDVRPIIGRRFGNKE